MDDSREQYPLGAWIVWPVGEPEAAIYTDSIIRREWVYWLGVLRGKVMAQGHHLFAGILSNVVDCARHLETLIERDGGVTPPHKS